MASLQQLVEQIALAAAATNSTITSRPDVAPGGPLGRLFAILSLLASTSALRDWALLLIIGSLFETARRSLSSFWTSIIDAFFLTAVFSEDDTSFKWMLVWLSKQPSWRMFPHISLHSIFIYLTEDIRQVAVSTDNFGVGQHPYRNYFGSPEEDLFSKKFSYLPAISQSYTLWYKRHWMSVTRISEPNHAGWGTKETLQLRLFTRSHKILSEILQEAKKEWFEAQKDFVTVWVDNCWKPLAKRPKRPLSSIILDPGVQELLLGDAKDFLESKPWYQERGIPFRRGYLLYGAPGSGKTSVIHSIAGELSLNIYILTLSRSGLDDSSLATLLSNLPERCIVLMEDIDAAFHHSLNREADKSPRTTSSSESGGREGSNDSPGKLSLSGILNAIDGISANEGRILFATTNKYSVLDPALCRPGRMDLHIEFHFASKYQARELFKRFFFPTSVSISTSAEKSDEKNECDGDVPDLIDLKSPEESHDVTPPIYGGISHRARAPKLSTEQLASLADQFATAVPERQLTMAALQGYLMTHKATPFDA
ncbi:hypothetical protein ID866_7196, partial [Astraeus odoratus]